MYELIRAGENSYYMDCPSKVGFFVSGSDAYMIDSGSDESSARKARQILEKNGWELRKIFLTHSHADHIGGAAFLQSRTGCGVFMAGTEREFCVNTLMELCVLFGSAPPKMTRNKFFMAPPSDTRLLTADELPDGLETISLPGHSPSMTGYRTRDGVIFLADLLSSASTLEKYGLGYTYDIAQHLSSLQAAESLEAKCFVSSHAETLEDAGELIELNRRSVLTVAERILSFTAEASSFEEILKRTFEAYSLKMDLGQYMLIGSTVKAYLSYLTDLGEIVPEVDSGMLKWVRKRS
ncbi:MAG: MBL fold metallo-hydrolase [Eubacteriaceae bacterium]|nr:MBL fold metallo-hydrolase [Eubacteriaceae bacterium]